MAVVKAVMTTGFHPPKWWHMYIAISLSRIFASEPTHWHETIFQSEPTVSFFVFLFKVRTRRKLGSDFALGNIINLQMI